jgi:hypothetical protein
MSSGPDTDRQNPGEAAAKRLLPNEDVTVVTSDEESTPVPTESWHQFTIERGFSYKTDAMPAGVANSIEKLLKILGLAALDMRSPAMDNSIVDSEITSFTDCNSLSQSLRDGRSVIKMAWEYEESCMIVWYCNAKGCRIALMYE